MFVFQVGSSPRAKLRAQHAEGLLPRSQPRLTVVGLLAIRIARIPILLFFSLFFRSDV